MRRQAILILTLIAALIAPASYAHATQPDDADPRIVGGSPATDQYGAVSLWDPSVGRSRCTATLVDPYWLLTAAHCDNVLLPGVTEVRASSRDNREGYEFARITDVYRHDGYDPATLRHDIALVRLDRKITRTDPLELSRNAPPVGTTTRIAGWGWTCEDASNPACRTTANILQQLITHVLPDSACVTLTDPAHQSCVVAADGSAASGCFGDSGGPMLAKRINEKWPAAGMMLADGDDFSGSSCATNPQGGPGAGLILDFAGYREWVADRMAAHSAP